MIFSVIVPAYNEEEYIAGCLKSLLDQDLAKVKYQIIVVNNTSTDKTVDIAKRYKVKVVNQPKKGVIWARQKGFEKATGKYIVYTDADCLVPKNWLSQILINFEKDKNIIAVAGPTRSEGKDFFSQVLLKMAVKANSLSFKLTDSVLAIWAGNLAIKRKALLKIGGYNTSLPQFADQLDIFPKLKKVGRIYFDKNLVIQESDRRYKNRLLAFLFKDCLYYNLLGAICYKLTGKHFGSWPDIR